MPANTNQDVSFRTGKLRFLPFPVDDPTRGETATRCQPLQEVARELTLAPVLGVFFNAFFIAVAHSLATRGQLSFGQPCTAFCVTSMPPSLE
jgi:hypothetical protein